MKSRPSTAAVAAVAALILTLAAAGPARSLADTTAASCDPMQTTPHFRGKVPTSQQVLGFPLGSQEVTAAQTTAYVDAVDAASPRVVSGTLGKSVQGRPIRYALVGKPENVTPQGLARIQQAARALRDPATSDQQAAEIADSSPAIVWLIANVHGLEKSPTDADLRVLYELADRDDCAAHQILDKTVIGIIPTQNPDGREADTRQNAYGFDLNRDWFARTQPETDAKLELLRQYPGILYMDTHENPGPIYFFPPTKDPTYHEVTDASNDWQDHLYGDALAAEFNRQQIPFFTNDVFDFFAMVYGDIVPATAFGGAGMTFEAAHFVPIEQRTYQHYVTQWVSISQAALNKTSILRRWHDEWRKAYREGLDGQLEPNEVNDPGNRVQLPVPTDPVRHYFLRADDPSKASEVQALVRRLQRMDVQVYCLSAPLTVPDFRAYGRPAAATVLPAGTYWIPMAQMQKHWIQAMLNEDTYVPFPYFYDVSGWSNPLLFNVSGGRSGAVLHPVAKPVQLLPNPPAPSLPSKVPSVALYQMSSGTSAFESAGWLRYLLEQVWHLPYQRVTSSDIAGGGLTGVDVLLVPNGVPSDALNELGPAGQHALVDWVNGGGRYVGWRGGADLAGRLGITTATLTEPTANIAGTLIRVQANESSPLTAGVGPFNWVYNQFDLVMRASDPSHVVLRYPDAASPDFFVSGYAQGQDELGGTAAMIDEPVGAGSVILSTTDPNFRAWTVGMQKVLWNAVLGPDAFPGVAVPAGLPARASKEKAARTAAASIPALESPLRISVPTTDADTVKALLGRYGAKYIMRQAGSNTAFLVANPGGLTGDDHPYAGVLASDLVKSGVHVLVFKAP